MKTALINWKTWLFWSSAILIGLFVSFFIPVKFILSFFADDGCFYLKTAYNFALGHGSTFDGINPTNGYQPLWFIILAVVFYISNVFAGPLQPETILRLSIFIEHILIVLTVFYTYKSFKLLFGNDAVTKTLLFFFVILTPLTFRNFGLEFHLTALVFALYVFVKCKEISLNENYVYAKISLFILLQLSRTDFLFTLVPVLIIYESYNRNYRIFLKNLAVYSIPCAAAAGVYFLINYLYFGHIFTISHMLKSTFPKLYIIRGIYKIIEYAAERSFPITNFSAFILLFLAFSLKTLWIKRKNLSKLEVFVFVLLAANFIFLLLNISFNVNTFHEWYFAGPVFTSTLAFSVFINKNKWINYSLICIFCIISGFYFYNGRIKNERFSSLYDYCMTIKQVVHEDEKILQIDHSGFVGLLSNRTVINGDGLINSFEYYEYCRNNKVRDYIEKYHIDYYSTYMAKVDSVKNIIIDYQTPVLGGYKLAFPLEKIKYHMPQIFESFLYQRSFEWYLIRLK